MDGHTVCTEVELGSLKHKIKKVGCDCLRL